jgi:hypothetical protein
MKKILIILGLILSVFAANAQIKAYTLEATEYLITDGDTMRATTQVDVNDTIMATKAYVLATTGAGNGWDSLVYYPTNGELVWWYSGSRIDSTSIDDRYVEYTDSVDVFYTQRVVDSLVSASGAQVVYSITLPNATTVQGRIDLAVEGTDYPTGWNLVAGSVTTDIDIEHSLGRYVASATVSANTGTSRQQLFGSAALSGVICDDDDNARVQSLATVAKEITIYITFK